MNQDLETIGQRLKWAMKNSPKHKCRISQKELAENIRVSQQTISAWIQNHTKPSLFYEKIADYLGVDVTWLAFGKGQPVNDDHWFESKMKFLNELTIEQRKLYDQQEQLFKQMLNMSDD